MDIEKVKDAFVDQYYCLLRKSPELVHKFYHEPSKLGRLGPDGKMTSVTTLEGINDKIVSLDYKDCALQIKTADAQESLEGGIILAVTGCLTDKENVSKNFSQMFFLAPQEKGGFYVLNDIFRFIDESEPVKILDEDGKDHVVEDSEVVNGAADHPVEKQEETVLTEAIVENGDVKKAPDQSVTEEKVADVVVSEPVVSGDDVSPVVTELQKAKEDGQKISYASMVAKESPVTSPAHALHRQVVRVSATASQQSIASPIPKASASVVDDTSKSLASKNVASKGWPPAVDVAPKPLNPHNNGAPNNTKPNPDGKSVYIGGLPFNITKNDLIVALKDFGKVRRGTESIQLRKHEDGFVCGFVEFESPEAARKAVEAHNITIGDKEAYITYKRSNRGSNGRARSPSARAGFQNNNFRGRENGNGHANRRYQNGNGGEHEKRRPRSSQRNGEPDEWILVER